MFTINKSSLFCFESVLCEFDALDRVLSSSSSSSSNDFLECVEATLGAVLPFMLKLDDLLIKPEKSVSTPTFCSANDFDAAMELWLEFSVFFSLRSV